MSPELPCDVIHLKVLIGNDILLIDDRSISGDVARRIAAEWWRDNEPELMEGLAEIVDQALEMSGQNASRDRLLSHLMTGTTITHKEFYRELCRHRYHYLPSLLILAANYSEEELRRTLQAISDYCHGK